MKSLAYVSRATIDFDDKALVELASFAAARNLEFGITGYLYFEDNYFTQYIEGESEPIDRLFQNLKHDARHDIRVVQVDEPLVQRRFASWHMRRIRRDEIVAIDLEKMLTDHLIFVSRLGDLHEQFLPSLWRMVDALSASQTRLSSSIHDEKGVTSRTG